MKPTLTAAEAADALGISTWTLREQAKQGTAPVMPIQIGRRQVWSTAQVQALTGAQNGEQNGNAVDPVAHAALENVARSAQALAENAEALLAALGHDPPTSGGAGAAG